MLTEILPASPETPAQPDQNAMLKDLANQIRSHHDHFEQGIRTSLVQARDAGEALQKAKEIVQAKKDSWQPARPNRVRLRRITRRYLYRANADWRTPATAVQIRAARCG